jgi:hypothetical protein
MTILQPPFAPQAKTMRLRMSTVTILTPSKPCFILPRIVGIEVDVHAGYSATSKFEHVAETSTRSLASRPGFNGHFTVRSSFNDQIVARRNESQTVIIVPNVFQGPLEPFNHFEKRLSSKSKSKFWEINFSVFMEKFKDVWTPLVSSYEIFSSNCYFILIVQTHFRSLFLVSRCDTERRQRQSPVLAQIEFRQQSIVV